MLDIGLSLLQPPQRLQRRMISNFHSNILSECCHHIGQFGRRERLRYFELELVLLKSESHERLKADLEEIAKMLSGLINGLENRKV